VLQSRLDARGGRPTTALTASDDHEHGCCQNDDGKDNSEAGRAMLLEPRAELDLPSAHTRGDRCRPRRTSDGVEPVPRCRRLSRRLEADLLRAGEVIVRVPPKLMAHARDAARTYGKSDPIDALAVARAAFVAHARELTVRETELEREITVLVREQAPTLLSLVGVGALTAAKIVAETADVTPFKSKDAHARHNGTAPLPVWSENRERHRLSLTGNRQLNAAIHRIAIPDALPPRRTRLPRASRREPEHQDRSVASPQTTPLRRRLPTPPRRRPISAPRDLRRAGGLTQEQTVTQRVISARSIGHGDLPSDLTGVRWSDGVAPCRVAITAQDRELIGLADRIRDDDLGDVLNTPGVACDVCAGLCD
jgi:hypothetical protein